MNTLVEERLVKMVRWIARLGGSLLLLLVVVIALGEGLPNFLKLTPPELVLQVALLGMMLGIITAWKWEGIGGSLVLAGFARHLEIRNLGRSVGRRGLLDGGQETFPDRSAKQTQ
jgi:hypothetical protein